MLVFPEQVLKGAIPNRDFLHLYGPGQPVGAGGRVQGVRRLAAQRARASGSLQQLAIVFGVYALARRWGRIARRRPPRSRRRSIIIPFGLTALAWVGGVGLAAAAASRPASRRAPRPDDRRARPVGVRRPGCCSGSRCCSGSTSCSASASRRSRSCAGMPTGRVASVCSPASRVGVAPYVDPARDRRARPRVPGHGARPRVPPPRRAAASRSRRRGATSTASCRRPARCNAARGRSRRRRVAPALPLVLPAARRDRVRRSWQGWRGRAPRSASRSPARTLLRRRALRPRDPPAGAATRRLRPLRVGELRRRSRFVPIALFEFVRRRARRRPTRRLALGVGRARCSRCSCFVLPAFTIRPYADYSLQTFGIHRAVVQDRARRPRLLLRQARPGRGRATR